ncbi:MAG: hypothetical protein KF799_13520 [Bdellovibrionales bacterium]|nr:hypothetical protein [Bdellovibrionales bacterium]
MNVYAVVPVAVVGCVASNAPSISSQNIETTPVTSVRTVSLVEEGKNVAFEALDRYSSIVSLDVAVTSYNKVRQV